MTYGEIEHIFQKIKMKITVVQYWFKNALYIVLERKLN